MPWGMKWIVAGPQRQSCEVPCSILTASVGHSKRKSHVARLPCQSSAEPDGKTRSVVCQYRADLRWNISLDRLLSTDGGGDAAAWRAGAVPDRAAGGRNSQLCLVLSRPCHAGNDDRIPALRRRQFHF